MPDRPTAVFISSDEQSIGVLLALHEAGVRVPEDIAVVSFDGSQEAAYCWPPLTTVAQPLEAMVDLAVGRMLRAEPGFAELATTLVIRQSCGCSRHPR
jgi:LacI family transcriptional regulator